MARKQSSGPRTPKGARASAASAYQKATGRTPPRAWTAAQIARRTPGSAPRAVPPLEPLPPVRAQPLPRSYDLTMPSRLPYETPRSAPAESALSRVGRYASPAMMAVAIAAAASQGYQQAKDDGAGGGEAVARGLASAVVPAAIAGSRHIAEGAGRVSEALTGIGGEMLKQTGLFDVVFLDMLYAKLGAAAFIGAAGAKGVELAARAASKAIVPVTAGVGALVGAMRDENALRGAGRGLVSAFDPSAIVMRKGIAEQAYDAVFGEPVRPQSWNGTLNRANPGIDTYQGRGAINRGWNDSRAAPARAQRGFSVANAAYAGMKGGADWQKPRGWANPKVQMAAQAARGRTFSGFKNGLA